MRNEKINAGKTANITRLTNLHKTSPWHMNHTTSRSFQATIKLSACCILHYTGREENPSSRAAQPSQPLSTLLQRDFYSLRRSGNLKTNCVLTLQQHPHSDLFLGCRTKWSKGGSVFPQPFQNLIACMLLPSHGWKPTRLPANPAVAWLSLT